MKFINPGSFLIGWACVVVAGLGFLVYLQWWITVWIILPVAISHVALLFGCRPAGMFLVAAYVLGIGVGLFMLATADPIWPPKWRLVWKLAMNGVLLHELYGWFQMMKLRRLGEEEC